MSYARLLSLLLVLFLFSCGQDDFMQPDSGIDTDTDMMVDPIPSEEIAATVSGIVIDEQNQPIPYASITADGRQQYTDELGYFSIYSEDMPLLGLYIKVAKEGYINGYTFIRPSDSATAFTKIQLVQPTIESVFSSDLGIDLRTPDGAALLISPHTIADAQGVPYSGEVNVSLRPYLTSDVGLSLQAPGDLRGMDAGRDLVQLVTYGMMSVELSSPDGEKLNILEGETAQLTFSISDEQSLSAPQEIPLWYFDEASGYWVEEGLAIKVDGTYIAEVSHFSFWNCDAPFPLVEVVGQILDNEGLPVVRRLVKVGVDGSGLAGYGYTDSQGFYRGKMPAGETMVLSIGNCSELIQISIGPFDTDTDLGALTIDRGPSGTISGRLIDCATMDPVSGYAYVYNDNESYVLETDDEGYYSGHIYLCDDKDFQIIGYDIPNAGVANPVDTSLVVDEELVLSDILICENSITFLTVQFANGGPQGNTNKLQPGQGFSYNHGALGINVGEYINSQINNSFSMQIYQPKPGDNIGRLAYSYASGGPTEFNDCELDSDCMSITISEYDLREGGYIGGRYSLSVDFGNLTGEFRCQIIDYVPDAPLECVDIASTNNLCVGDAPVSLLPHFTGGVAPFVYTWDDGTVGVLQTSGERLYTVEVTDYVGNTCSRSLDYKSSPVLEFETSSIPANCDMADGSAIIDVLNYSGDFSITWEDGTVGNTLANVPEGFYRATVVFNEGKCTRNINVIVPGC